MCGVNAIFFLSVRLSSVFGLMEVNKRDFSTFLKPYFGGKDITLRTEDFLVVVFKFY